MLAILKVDGRRPGQLKDLRDVGRSACPKSMVDTANPGLAQLCNEGENPVVTLPKSDKNKPIRLICTIERAGPRQTNALRNDVKPVSAYLEIDITSPQRASDRTGSEDAK